MFVAKFMLGVAVAEIVLLSVLAFVRIRYGYISQCADCNMFISEKRPHPCTVCMDRWREVSHDKKLVPKHRGGFRL